jgi:hypothetical protein
MRIIIIFTILLDLSSSKTLILFSGAVARQEIQEIIVDAMTNSNTSSAEAIVVQ